MLNLTKKSSLYLVVFFVLLFVTYNTYLISEEQYWGIAIPLVLGVVYLTIVRVDLVLTLVAFLTPLSTSLRELGISNPLGIEMALPTEPLLFGLMLVAWVKMFSDRQLFKGLYSHPISIAIIV